MSKADMYSIRLRQACESAGTVPAQTRGLRGFHVEALVPDEAPAEFEYYAILKIEAELNSNHSVSQAERQALEAVRRIGILTFPDAHDRVGVRELEIASMRVFGKYNKQWYRITWRYVISLGTK